MQYAATFGFRIWLQPLDPYLARGGVAHDGEVASRLGLPGIPASAEIVALYTYLRLAKQTGARLHITRVSCGESLDLIERARQDGVDVTCDVAAHHLHLCDMDIGYFNPHCHVVPPLRSQRDRIALSRGLADGRINAICSDHTPVDDDAKQAPFSESEPGTTGLELLLPLTLKWAASPPRPRRSPASPRVVTYRSAPAPTSASLTPILTSSSTAACSGARARTRPSWASSCRARFATHWSKAR